MTPSIIWEAPLSPGEVKDYTLDAGLELTTVRDTIVSSEWTLDPTAIAAGILIHSSTNSDLALTVWLKVDPTQQDAALFDDPGTLFTAKGSLTTAGGRTYERTCQFKVVRL